MNAIFTGRKRSGKTTLAFDMAMRDGGGIFIYDPKGEWRNWPGIVTSVSQIEQKIKDGNDIIVFKPSDPVKEFAPLADYIAGLHRVALDKGWSQKNTPEKEGLHFTFIIDEAHNVCSDKAADPKLISLVSINRPEILNIFLTFQSPKDVYNRLKSRFDNWFVFNTSLPSDLQYLNKEVGVPDYDLEEIRGLKPHEYAHFFFDGGAPKVTFDYDADAWFRPLEFFELNQNEREDVEMGRERDSDDLKDLFEDFLDFMDEKKRRSGSRESRDRDDRDDDRERRPRRRESSRSGLSGY